MATDHRVLDNVVWHALTTTHVELAEIVGRARRYPAEVSVFGAVDNLDDGAWHDLALLAGPRDDVMLFRDEIPTAPHGWSVVLDGVGNQMVLEELRSHDTVRARRLDTTDVPQMLDLVTRTEPGPFAARTIELGMYYGVFDDHRLVAMAGERLRVRGYTEVSAVCTDPAVRGRGLATGLTARVAAGILERGDMPFLHHSVDNHSARRVYERLGFVSRREVAFRRLRAPIS